MSDHPNLGFGQFVPGFDFLQNLAKGASQTLPQMPNLSNWIAPTLNVKELERRISELKAVHFWLDQNSKALGATIQALEVQKMTLATLEGMNFNMGEVANALTLKATDTMFGGMQKMSEKVAGAASKADAQTSAKAPRKPAAKSSTGAATASVVDPMQWWGALTQQFQQIAASAMKDVATNTAFDAARNMATDAAKEAFKSADSMAKAATGDHAGARQTAARRSAAKKARPR
jgi:hypothetical protein